MPCAAVGVPLSSCSAARGKLEMVLAMLRAASCRISLSGLMPHIACCSRIATFSKPLTRRQAAIVPMRVVITPHRDAEPRRMSVTVPPCANTTFASHTLPMISCGLSLRGNQRVLRGKTR
jgi:hypothetical protein